MRRRLFFFRVFGMGLGFRGLGLGFSVYVFGFFFRVFWYGFRASLGFRV